jgi:hypothetical protein
MIPGSVNSRQNLSDLIEGRLSSPAGLSGLVELATRLIIEEALEGEATDVVGREYYEHDRGPGSGYRNGNRTGRLKTAEGMIEYRPPAPETILPRPVTPIYATLRSPLQDDQTGQVLS